MPPRPAVERVGALYRKENRRGSVTRDALRRVGVGVQRGSRGTARENRIRVGLTAPAALKSSAGRAYARAVSTVPALLALLMGARGAPAAIPAAVVDALARAPAGGPRAAAATRPLLGIRYQLSALGEGAGIDPDPRFRLDAFDCLTFVETAIALGSSRTLDEAARALDDIRYEGAPAFAARHHEVQAQWIPANLARGWIADLARDLVGERAVPIVRDHTAASWAAVHRAGRGIAGLPRDREPIGHFETWAIRPEDLAGAERRIPEGTVIVVLRADSPRRPTRVSHTGLVVVGAAGERLVRHATSTPGLERVIEEPLARFVAREARAYPSWPLVGFGLYGIPDSSARVAGLAR